MKTKNIFLALGAFFLFGASTQAATINIDADEDFPLMTSRVTVRWENTDVESCGVWSTLGHWIAINVDNPLEGSMNIPSNNTQRVRLSCTPAGGGPELIDEISIGFTIPATGNQAGTARDACRIGNGCDRTDGQTGGGGGAGEATWREIDEDVQGSQCAVDLGAQLPEGTDWGDVYQIRDEMGRTWQRAIVGSITEGTLEITEGEATDIFITGQPNNPIQVFFVSADNDERPTTSVCVNAGNGNQNGQATFPVHARFLWPLIDREIMLDAWTLLEGSWEGKTNEETVQNFQMGTHLPAPEVTITVAEMPTRCTGRVCNGSPYFLVSRILPNRFPSVAKGVFPFPEGSTTNTFAEEVLISKLSPTTYYAMVDSNSVDPSVTEGNEQYIDRALTIEILKRILLGTVGNSIQTVDTIEAQQFLDIVTSEQNSTVKDIVENIRDALLYAEENEIRIEALEGIESEIRNLFPRDADIYAVPDISAIAELFPAAEIDPLVDEETGELILSDVWATQLVEVCQLWTGSTEANECLLESNFNVEVNFLRAPDAVTEESAPDVSCRSVNIQASRPRGADPIVVLPASAESTTLSPDFFGMSMTRSQKAFETGTENWILEAGETPNMSYEYRIEAGEFSPSASATSCVSAEETSTFSAHLQENLGMPELAQSFFQKELATLLSDATGYVEVTLANPTEISSRIAWKVNGEKKVIPQAFLKTGSSCEKESFETPTEAAQKFFEDNLHNGYGIGLYR